MSFLPLYRRLDVIVQTNFSIIIAHCFVVIYSEGTYGTEPRQMMKLAASANAKLFGHYNYSRGTSADCAQYDLPLNITRGKKVMQAAL